MSNSDPVWCQQWDPRDEDDAIGYWAVYQRKDLICGPPGWTRVGPPYKVDPIPGLDFGEIQEGVFPPNPYKPTGEMREREAALVAIYMLKTEAQEQSALMPEENVARKQFYEGQRSACEILVASIARGRHLELFDAQNPKAN